MAKYQPPEKQKNKKRNKTGYNIFFSAHVLELKKSEIGVPSERGSVARIVGNAWKVRVLVPVISSREMKETLIFSFLIFQNRIFHKIKSRNMKGTLKSKMPGRLTQTTKRTQKNQCLRTTNNGAIVMVMLTRLKIEWCMELFPIMAVR